MYKWKEDHGSLTLEACISFVFTFLLIISFMFFIKVVYVHSIIQHALTQTANELANYSYLYSVSPLAPINDAMVNSTSENIDKLNDDIQEVVDVWNSVAANNDNPKDLFKALTSVLVSGASENAKSYAGSLISKALMEKYLAVPGTAANNRLLKLQVIDGIEGLDLSGSRFFSDKQNIDLIVCYQMKNIAPLQIMPDLYLINRAAVRGWLNNSRPSLLTNSISIWDPAVDDKQRGLILQKEAGLRNLPNNFKTFSHFANGVATACVSLDPREASYAGEAQIKSNLKQKCAAMENFTGYKSGGEFLSPNQIQERRLVILVPAQNSQNPDVNNSAVARVAAQLQGEYPNIKIEVREIDKVISK